MRLYLVDCNVYVVLIEDVTDLRQLGLVIINHSTPNPVRSVKRNELVSSDDTKVVATTLKRTVKIEVSGRISIDNSPIIQDSFISLDVIDS